MPHIEVRVADGSGRPEYYAEVTAYKGGFWAGGTLGSEHTDRDGLCWFDLDLGAHDKVSFVARSGGRRGESDEDYPRARVHLVLD